MLKIQLSIILYLIFSISLTAQNYYYGWINNLRIGNIQFNNNLEKVVYNINKKEIKFVVITGDIGGKITNKGLKLTKKILDSLDVPYYIMLGNHYTKWIESGNAKFKQLGNEGKFVFQYDSVKHIAISSGIPWRGKGHISIEDLLRLDTVLAKTQRKEQIIFYIHYPLDIDNWFKVTNLLKGYNVEAVLTGHGQINKIMNFHGIPMAISGVSLDKNQENWNYTLVHDKPDSILFYEVNKDSIPQLWGAIKKSNLRIPFIDSTQFINYTESPNNGG
ncbi:MAG TPA: hypothetical protein ENI76_02940, partial [Ignavibacteria bacterium]|nr:hypothetical protein [Ignavibacteria bacterium]